MKFQMLTLGVWGAVLGLTMADDEPEFHYDPNTIKGCTYWYDNDGRMTCEQVRIMFLVTPETFTRWNPSVTVDCKGWTGQSYCVQVKSELPPPSSTTTTSSSTQTTITSTKIKPTPTAWKELGCYKDGPHHPLSNKSSNAGGSDLTRANCEHTCWVSDFEFAGVKAGNECWCGNYVDSDWTDNQADCNIPCAGAASEKCGGSNLYNIFSADVPYTFTRPFPASTDTSSSLSSSSSSFSSATSTKTSSVLAPAPTAGWQAVGCYKDLFPSNDRTLKDFQFSTGSLTVASCQSRCLNAKYKYSGVENGEECWCGNDIQSPNTNSPVAASDCGKPCTGEKDTTCGAGARIYLYKYVIPPTGTWIFIGCYGEEDPRILRNILDVPGGQGNNTQHNCIDTCDKRGYVYAGVENGGECWCDSVIHPPGKLAPDGTAGCNKPCPGKASETCGGYSRLDVFKKS